MVEAIKKHNESSGYLKIESNEVLKAIDESEAPKDSDFNNIAKETFGV